MKSIQVNINGEKKIFDKVVSLSDIVQENGLDLRKIAVERNLTIIPRQDYKKTILENGDNVEIIEFIGGG